MTTLNYAMVRGSALRVTALTPDGRLSEPGKAAVSRSVVRVTVNEVTDEVTGEVFRDTADQSRIALDAIEDSIGYTVDAEFLRVDPGLLSLMTGVPLSTNANGDVTGYDAQTRLPMTAFGLEVWSKLSGVACPPSQRKWGYTLFPYLAGGILSGFKFGEGLVSFGMKGAVTRITPMWGRGPYDIDGPWGRLVTPVSRNESWRQMVVNSAPPPQADGIIGWTDAIDNGTAAVPGTDIFDAGTINSTAAVIDGGAA